ncbi:MAG TPA: hypothetical protein VGD46_17380 [Rhizobacter sp.]
MNDSLFLPRELFEPPSPAVPSPSAPAPRRGTVQFTSGADVAADLLQAMRPDDTPAFVERRRRPRTGKPFDTTR